MTTTTPILSEKDIAAPVVRTYFANMQTREELLILHPNGGQYPVDIVARVIGAFGDGVIVCEVKRRATLELFDQCMRWVGIANQVFAAILTPTRRDKAFRARVMRFASNGIGVILSDGHECDTAFVPEYNRDAKNGCIIRAFDATPECGPSAGSAAAQRMTDSRREWKDIIEWLKTETLGASFREIKRATRTRKTAASLRKAIDIGGLPLEYEGYPESWFSYVEEKRA